MQAQDLISRWLRGQPKGEIALALKMSVKRLDAQVSALGLPERHRAVPNVGPADLPRYAALFEAHQVSVFLIADVFRVSRSAVRVALAEAAAAARIPEALKPCETPPAAVPVWSQARLARLESVIPGPGSWAVLSALAAEWDVPMRAVQARWHQVRRAA